MQGIFRKENTDKALKYGIYRHLPTYEKIIRNLVSFFNKIYKKAGVLRRERLFPLGFGIIRRWCRRPQSCRCCRR
ncbi:MAG TPA: hypothetical protein DER21_04655 [Ruminococcaceae bacterium]|nr:hypothetical protein [Oscillospiraceae bacterium]